jgi:4-amino-4-deoxy-L-arabinose transferase-like glycosyltransferase
MLRGLLELRMSQTQSVSSSSPARKIPRHRLRGGALFAIGAVFTFLVMANSEQMFRGALYGFVTSLIMAVGLIDLLGLFSAEGYDADSLAAATDWKQTALSALPGESVWLSPRVVVPAALAIFIAGAVLFGIHGMPVTILVTLGILSLLAFRRPSMLLFVLVAAIFLPFLGVYGLWDPWETHYGEVAREILSRDDWISLWWAQEDWFWSKPIFIFWIEALSMSAFGVGFQPDANPVSPEWAIRFPHFLLATFAIMALYAAISRVFGKRAGVFSGLVLATMPHYFMLSHQAITDMPFVSTMTMAMSMFALALSESPDRKVRLYRFGRAVLSVQHLVVFAFAMVCLPQILLLITRNVSWVTGGFHWHGDEFVFGSAGNAGNPGNAEMRPEHPAFIGIGAQPVTQGLIWLTGLIVILASLRKERRAQSLAMYAFYFFCALSFMAKGIPGFALPGMVALFYLIASRRWDLLLEGRLRVALGMLIVVTVGMPWYVAMYIRHGQGFTDRLLVHDHINRLTAGVHGDTGSIEYFLEQLGTGLFPWVALIPMALGIWIVSSVRAGERDSGVAYRSEDGGSAPRSPEVQRALLMVFGLWGTSAFVLFSAMTTKFHHYIFPTVPACGVLVGLALDRLYGEPSDLESPTASGALTTVLAFLAPIPAVIGVAGLWGNVRGVVPDSVRGEAARGWVMSHPWSSSDCYAWIALSVALFALTLVLSWKSRTEGEKARWTPAASSALIAAPAIAAMVGRDLSWVTSARPAGYERLIHLFVYNYQRLWPEQFDYRPILTGFATLLTLAIGLALIPALRRVALTGFMGLAVAFAMWALDVYIVDLSPHWGQRELFEAYYRERSGPEQPVLAWQMNWKGENFYTGNAVLAFPDLDNRKLQDWTREHAGETVFVVLEHTRVASLRNVLRGAEISEVTDLRVDNKFIMVRAHLPGAPTRTAPRPSE